MTFQLNSNSQCDSRTGRRSYGQDVQPTFINGVLQPVKSHFTNRLKLLVVVVIIP